MYRRRIEIAKDTIFWSNSDREKLEMSVKIWLVTKELKELEMSNSKRDTAFEQLPTEEIKKLRMRACKRELLPSRSCLRTR